MKKSFQKMVFVVASILMAAPVVSSCDDDDEQKTSREETFKQAILGKWKMYSTNGVLTLTDRKNVQTFNADGTVCGTTFAEGLWFSSVTYTYSITDNQYTENVGNLSVKGIIASISNTELLFSSFTVPGFEQKDVKMTKVEKDFSKSIVGLWEGVEMTGEETYGSADHRWEYKADGSYLYYSKDGEGKWVADDAVNAGNVYYVDGDFLGSRWTVNGVEYKEWWDIDSCDDKQMVWSALRMGKDGKQYTTTFTMKRVTE